MLVATAALVLGMVEDTPFFKVLESGVLAIISEGKDFSTVAVGKGDLGVKMFIRGPVDRKKNFCYSVKFF